MPELAHEPIADTCPGIGDLPKESIGAVQNWIETFVKAPHPRLGRTGPVCPFVDPAMRQDTLMIRERQIASGSALSTIVGELRDCVREFRDINWSGNRILHAMLVLFPRLADEDGFLLDEAHALIKDELVPQDVMMAPLHPQCTEPAARSTELLAFRSPVPMIAVRRLAFHDILFLYQKRDWFFHYARQYGERYEKSAGIDPEYRFRYELGIREFGHPHFK
jgi:hypothetical protein